VDGSGRPDGRTLRELYHGVGLTLREIGRRYAATAATVLRWMAEAGVERRPPGRVSGRPGCEELFGLYVDEVWSLEELAEEYEVSAPTVRRWLLECEIPVRSGWETVQARRRLREAMGSEGWVPRTRVGRRRDV